MKLKIIHGLALLDDQGRYLIFCRRPKGSGEDSSISLYRKHRPRADNS